MNIEDKIKDLDEQIKFIRRISRTNDDYNRFKIEYEKLYQNKLDTLKKFKNQIELEFNDRIFQNQNELDDYFINNYSVEYIAILEDIIKTKKYIDFIGLPLNNLILTKIELLESLIK